MTLSQYREAIKDLMDSVNSVRSCQESEKSAEIERLHIQWAEFTTLVQPTRIKEQDTLLARRVSRLAINLINKFSESQ